MRATVYRTVAIGAVVLLAGACGSAARTTAPVESRGQISVSTTAISTVAQIGDTNNAGDSGSMVGDRSSSGVWLWTSSAAGAELVHWVSSTASFTRWPIGSAEDDIVPAEKPSLAIASDNTTAWLAQNDELIRIDLTTGKVQRFAIPIGADNTAQESFRPPEVKGTHAAVAVAVSPAGDDVVVSLSAVSAVEDFNPATQTFTERQLPAEVSADGVAFLRDGRLLVGVSNYKTSATDTVLASAPGSTEWTSVAVPDSSAVITTTDGAVLVGGTITTEVTDQLSTTSLNTTSSEGVLPATQIFNGNRVIPERDGLVVATASGTTVNSSSWPTGVCSSFSAPPYVAPATTVAGASTTTTVSPATTECPLQAVAMVADGVGNVWLQLQSSKGLELAQLPSASATGKG